MSLWDINEVASILPLRELKPVGWPCGVPDFNGRHEFLGRHCQCNRRSEAECHSEIVRLSRPGTSSSVPSASTCHPETATGYWQLPCKAGAVPRQSSRSLAAGSRQRTAHGIPGAPHIPRRIQLVPPFQLAIQLSPAAGAVKQLSSHRSVPSSG